MKKKAAKFIVKLIHNDGGHPLFEIPCECEGDAVNQAVRATDKLRSASAYIMPGFSIYKNGKHIETKNKP